MYTLPLRVPTDSLIVNKTEKIMRFISCVFPETASDEGWETANTVVCWLELIIMAISLIPIAAASILNTKHRIFHWNANLIVMVYSSQYIVSCASRLVLILDQLKADGVDANLELTANYVRTGCHFLSFYVLPAFLFERCWASFYLKDYEKKFRLWIPLIAIGALLTSTIISTYFFVNEYITLLPTLIIVMMANSIGFIGLIMLQNYNIKLHRRTLDVAAGNIYSLSERFQIAENIKTSELLTKVQILIFVFTVACAMTLLLDFANASAKVLICAYTAFNYICVAYGFIVPLVCLLHLPVWQRSLKTFLHRIMCNRAFSSTVQLQSTTGEKLSFHGGGQQGDVYFQQFHSQLHDFKRSRSNPVSVR